MAQKRLELFVEIGTEEIPARFIPRALEDLAAAARASLEARRLAHGALLTFGTPRRLALCVKRVAARQPDLEREVTGPPQKAAYDESSTGCPPRRPPSASSRWRPSSAPSRG